MTMVACSSSSSSSSLPDTVFTTTLLRVKRLVSAAGIFALAMTQLLGIQQAYNMTRDFRFNTSSSIPALEQLIDATALVTKIVTTSSFPAAGRPGIQWKNRNYMSHPVTAAESRYISFMNIENAKRMNHSKILKVAVCHPTMFGDLLLDTHFAWVSYYRLLGFDHIFLWYEENISKLPRFDELAALPYVTLTLHNYSDTTGIKEVYHGQTTVEKECFTMANHSNFDWALPIDVDEYIWFQKPQSIQDFLTHYEQQGLAYISLGKHHYSTRHVYRSPDDDEDDDADAGFGLEQYPYTPGTYCNRNPGNFICPNWLGRSKVLAKPSRFNHVNIHVSASRETNVQL
jgi:Glycosyltransferase family 92